MCLLKSNLTHLRDWDDSVSVSGGRQGLHSGLQCLTPDSSLKSHFFSYHIEGTALGFAINAANIFSNDPNANQLNAAYKVDSYHCARPSLDQSRSEESVE